MNYAGSPLEIKEIDSGGRIEGLLAGFSNLDSHGDVIEATALSKSLADRKGRPLPMLLHHDLKRPIGAFTSWDETQEGLYVRGSLEMSVRDAQEAYSLAKGGALTGLSIGYTVKQARRDPSSGANILKELHLVEGSLVTVPSNPKTHVSAIKAITGPRDIADMLRECGVSGRKAKIAAGAAWRSIIDGGADEQEAAEILIQSANRIAKIGVS